MKKEERTIIIILIVVLVIIATTLIAIAFNISSKPVATNGNDNVNINQPVSSIVSNQQSNHAGNMITTGSIIIPEKPNIFISLFVLTFIILVILIVVWLIMRR